MALSSGHKGISRIDQLKKHTHGWYVRVRFNNTSRAKFFSDEAHGGEEKALEKAVAYRNRLERELGKPRTDRAVIASSPRNSTGVIGIQRTVKVARMKNGERSYSNVYEVTWSVTPGVLGRTSVSIDKHGDQEAFRRACAIRRAKEREMYGEVVAPNWSAALGKLFTN